MAGGVGQRFWPKGTSKIPKQFLKISHDTDTMIQQTVKRLDGFISPNKTFVVTNRTYKNIVRKQIPQIPEENIICEPFGRNTAPCIGLACIFINRFEPKGNVFVLPADHVIEDLENFRTTAKCGLKFSEENGGIVTLGILPTKPETGYGYIQFDPDKKIDISFESGNNTAIEKEIFKVKTFAEKPSYEIAKTFIDNGDFLWNSGMFIFRVDSMMDEIKSYLPDLYEALIRLESTLLRHEDFDKALENEYSLLKGISVDYGIMEKSKQVYIIKSNFGWNDLGSWDEIYNMRSKDTNGNASEGMTLKINSKNCLVINDQRITALVGVEDLLVIDTDNGLLVCKRGESQNVKEVVDYLRRKGMEEYL